MIFLDSTHEVCDTLSLEHEAVQRKSGLCTYFNILSVVVGPFLFDSWSFKQRSGYSPFTNLPRAVKSFQKRFSQVGRMLVSWKYFWTVHLPYFSPSRHGTSFSFSMDLGFESCTRSCSCNYINPSGRFYSVSFIKYSTKFRTIHMLQI